MEKKNAWVIVAVLVLLISMGVNCADNQGENGNNGNGTKVVDPGSTHYILLTAARGTGQERALCLARGRCFLKTLQCPAQCYQRKPKKARKVKGCFVDCGRKCETTCKFRLPNCNGYGSVCYDPRFVGGDGVMFYFHGGKGRTFALVSDDHLQINAHFIGTRPHGRARDFTWVKALAVMFDAHALVISADRVSKWHDDVDALSFKWDGKEISVPTDGEDEWRTLVPTTGGEFEREVVVERTDVANSVRITVAGLVEIYVKVVPISEEENRAHNYQLPVDDSFAHLETQFRFVNLTESVEGVLGQTYRPGYVSPVKAGVPMPMMGGEEKYQTPSFLSNSCIACRFKRWSAPAEVKDESTGVGIAKY